MFLGTDRITREREAERYPIRAGWRVTGGAPKNRKNRERFKMHQIGREVGAAATSADRGGSDIRPEAATGQRAIRRFYRPGVLELALKIIARELDAIPPANHGEEIPT